MNMYRFTVVEFLPDNFRLAIFTDYLLQINGNWQVTLNIDKSASMENTLVVTPGIQASVTSGWDQTYRHNITVDKVLISPFGSQLVLKEMSFDGKFFGEASFALRDEQGRFLDVITSQRWAAPDNKTMEVTNSFEFLNSSTKMKSLTLIPLASNLVRQNGSSSPVMATAPPDRVPFQLQQSELFAQSPSVIVT